MDEGTRTSGTQVSDADSRDRTPDEIRSDIAQTREELGDTVEALAAKTDVKAQAKAKVDDAKTHAKERPQKPLGIAAAIAGLIVLLVLVRRRRGD